MIRLTVKQISGYLQTHEVSLLIVPNWSGIYRAPQHAGEVFDTQAAGDCEKGEIRQ